MRKGLAQGLAVDYAGGLEETVTPHAGVGVLIEVARRSNVMAAAEKHLPDKQSPRGLRHGEMVEAFVLLSALGGDCLDDFDTLRKDAGLAALLGYTLPAASTARQWLDRFHDEELVARRPAQGSFIPQESSWLAKLDAVVGHSIRTYIAAVQPGPEVTFDVDAHLVESSKVTALRTYEGFRGFQPMLVSWKEQHNLIMADEQRDGNVPASVGIYRMVDRARDRLPQREGGWRIAVRADSAAYEYEALDHWAEQGWRFAVSADMSAGLRQELLALPGESWHFWKQERDGVVREWAEVPYVPSRQQERKDIQPYRYVAIRVRPPQGQLLGDGNEVRHFAVVTNDWEMEGQALLEWHRGKQGTIEQVHRVLKDELGAGVYPSGKFGANAAWLRLQVLTFNLLELMKATALDESLRQARPKRLRFAIFSQVGRLVRHAGGLLLRVTESMLHGLVWPVRRRLKPLGWASA